MKGLFLFNDFYNTLEIKKVSFANSLINLFNILKSFSELGLSKPLMQVLPELGFENPSPIQEQAIPLLNEKPQDFIGLAQTGTGKTAAFGLPLLDWINPDQKDTQALILAPTRELGQQIAGQLEIFAKYLPNIRIQSVYGGASIVVQMKDIKRRTPQIVIATPGRLLDLMRRKVLDLSTIKFVVLDEADEMLNMGFKEDLDDILAYTGDSKNTWLFSATMPKEIRHIVKSYMSNPVEVKVSTGNQVNENIEHQYAVVKSSDKFEGFNTKNVPFSGDLFDNFMSKKSEKSTRMIKKAIFIYRQGNPYRHNKVKSWAEIKSEFKNIRKVFNQFTKLFNELVG